MKFEIILKIEKKPDGEDYEYLVHADFSDDAAPLVNEVLTHYRMATERRGIVLKNFENPVTQNAKNEVNDID
ncbi:MAG: hypothetical protein M3209_09565 [Acidobacteriota bacterium]|nr:hypothetical protein [Acidobacteriota bacterium]